jgi:hypothetical protein
MPVKYTKDEIINNYLKNFLTEQSICNLYAENFINWTGIVKSGNEKYSEVIAEQLLLPENLKLLESISVVKRTGRYKAGREYKEIDKSSPRIEEQTARSMKGKNYRGIGTIIDYQTPLKNERNDKSGRSIGKIDLLSWDEESQSLFVIEFKLRKSPETLLRCVLEAYTYWKTVNHEKLAENFGHPNAKVRAAVLIYCDSQAGKDYFDDNQPHVKKLMERLDVQSLVINDES